MNPLTYLRTQLKAEGENFVSQWGKLNEKDKVDMKGWAVEEMNVLGIEVKE